MKKAAIDPADLALERAKQLRAVQISRGGDEPGPLDSPPEEAPSPSQLIAVDEPPKEALTPAKPEKAPRKKPTYDKRQERWKTSVQLSRRHEKIVNEFLMHYRMQGLRPVSVNTIILAALDVLKRSPELDEVIQAIVADDRRVTR